ncbi:MAG: hypothetical protein PHZ11_00650 [Desulfitobacteriaceae bacterium]|nr:hypothetical protein [Desulfitobacteriaceae bacterium]MDD4345404.1 hypothetical protein [Desulfitobacteriaceae bacterium]MDD4402105.1 hypothetical protein [Desulfitobacteriaceae bacterium]
MEEKMCKCKSSNFTATPSFLGGLIAYQLAVIIILLLFLHIDFNDIKENLKQESLKKESCPEE